MNVALIIKFKMVKIIGLIAILAAFFGCSACLGQSDLTALDFCGQFIVNASSYEEGIYLSFDEFKYNSPGILGDVEYDHGLHIYDEELGEQRRISKRKYWGFCDGKEIYINYGGKIFLLQDVGRYSYFEFSHFEPDFLVIGHIPIGSFKNSYHAHEYVLSIKNGNVYNFSPDVMEKILRNSSDQLKMDFVLESKSNLAMREILRQYNKEFSPYKE